MNVLLKEETTFMYYVAKAHPKVEEFEVITKVTTKTNSSYPTTNQAE